jgi:hypothetical protein
MPQREEQLCPYGDSNSDQTVFQPVANRYTDCPIPPPYSDVETCLLKPEDHYVYLNGNFHPTKLHSISEKRNPQNRAILLDNVGGFMTYSFQSRSAGGKLPLPCKEHNCCIITALHNVQNQRINVS